MNVLIIMGSPRLSGNTAELCKPFIDKLKENLACVKYVTLTDKKISPCKACYTCQNIADSYGCVQKDEMYSIVEDIIWADLIVLATPIYSWYCSAEMKTLLDRHYGLNKFYGNSSGSLWAGKKVAIISTHGYERDYAVTPFTTGVERLCVHSNLSYLGIYSVRDTDNITSFKTKDAIDGAKEFACLLLAK